MIGGLRHPNINNTRVATSKREEENMRCGVISRLSQVHSLVDSVLHNSPVVNNQSEE